MTGGFRYEPYDWRGTTEWILVHAANSSTQIIIIPPLFEEMNYLRRFIVDVARSLAAKGIGSWLPDLPGTGESLHHLHDMTWDDWRHAIRVLGQEFATKTGARPHVASFRGGVLLSDAVDACSWWSYAPAPGASLHRYLRRTKIISDIRIDTDHYDNKEETDFYGGYELSRPMREGLAAAVEPSVSGPRRTVPAAPGTPLWRRSEPGSDPALSAHLADDIATWIATCADR